MTNAVIVCPVLKANTNERDFAHERLNECVMLAQSIGLNVLYSDTHSLDKVRPSHYIGFGVVHGLTQFIQENNVAVAIVDASLSPIQQRNLERDWQCKVIDRTGLILEIFGARARTHEGQLQVELASLSYQKGRLVRSWTHLERQRGGFGFLGGPGESQLEIDRRLINDRITKIRKELATVTRTRGLHRDARASVPFPTIALVGYTNAGKSTLFNTMTNSNVLAEDRLFATLDPTMRAFDLTPKHKAILSDTVGFISYLPTTLVAAFRATLEEVLNADIILHVADVSHEQAQEQEQQVLSVLKEIGLDEAMLAERMIMVWNKIDVLDDASRLAWQQRAAQRSDAATVSGLTGEGVDILRQKIAQHCFKHWQLEDISLNAGQGEAIAWLYEHGRVLQRTNDDHGACHLHLAIRHDDWQRFHKRFSVLS